MSITSSVIPHEELREALLLYSIITHDETVPLGQVRLVSDGRRRRWYATDSVRAACVEGGPEDEVFDVGIPPAQLNFAVAAARVTDDVRLTIDADDDVLTLGGSEGSLRVEDMRFVHADVPGIRPGPERIRGRVLLPAQTLHRLISSIGWIREVPEGDEPSFRFWFGIGTDKIQLRAKTREAGPTFIDFAAPGANGDVAVEISAKLAVSIIELFDQDDEILVEIPEMSGEPVVFSAGSRWALLMPIEHPANALRKQVESTITDVMGQLAAQPDGDGDYPLVRHSTPVYARLLPDAEPPALQVFAVMLSDVEASPELMTELNDLNIASTFARIFHVDGQVLVEADLVAETLDPNELRAAVDQIWDVAQRIMPTLSAVFGGQLVPDPAAVRLGYYRTTIVEAEVAPGVMVQLNGPGGVAEWPFPGQVHVMTGWNPQGVALAVDQMNDINRQLAGDIIRAGGRFVFGVGRAPDGSHEEPSLFAWGLDRAVAVELGERARQDAIFEMDA
ncbi:MAG: DUF3293 domain-containing protein, partial [Ilumatobacteraceae bacterium]